MRSRDFNEAEFHDTYNLLDIFVRELSPYSCGKVHLHFEKLKAKFKVRFQCRLFPFFLFLVFAMKMKKNVICFGSNRGSVLGPESGDLRAKNANVKFVPRRSQSDIIFMLWRWLLARNLLTFMLHDVPIPNDRNTMKLFERSRIVEE